MDSKNGDTPADKQLVAKILAGDQAAFTQLVKDTERLVAQIVFKMIARQEERKDIAQEVYIKVYRKLPGFLFQARLSTWIAQICYNTCLDHLRKKKLLLVEAPGEDNDENEYPNSASVTGDSELLDKDRKKLLDAAISRLPPLYQTLIGLYHSEELRYDEIVEITGLPEGTVKSYLHRARKLLRTALSDHHKKGEL